jgi:SAM-dependent MidA family methyltransferase
MPPLKRQLLSRIHKNGPISFSEFMAACLYDPLHGYYASAKARIGKAGDFVTAVSSGPLFGKLLARQFVQMWELLERPTAWTLVEQGAFDGRLALDILSALAEFAPACLQATTLRIVEPFSRLQTNQAATLHAYRNQVSWHRSIESLPAFCGVHYSNELLDAFPVHRIQSTGTGWEEMKVAAQNADLCWETSSPSCSELTARANCLPQREAGFLAEVGLQHREWLSEIQARMQRGWVLTFDYGFPEALFFVPERREGTIAAYRAHKRLTDPLEDPGDSDLTSHVNFTQIAENL